MQEPLAEKLGMNLTAPKEFESRAEFLVRLRRQATWLNDNKHDIFLDLCTNQKQRCKDIVKLKGAKSKW